MNYKELQRALDNAKPADFSTPATKSVSKSHESVLLQAVSAMTFVVDRLEQQVSELQKRIEELERKGYVGIWKDGKEYSPQSECTHDGARWLAHKRTSDRPGASGDWTMIEKSNPHSDAGTTSHPRSNGHYANPRSRTP